MRILIHLETDNAAFDDDRISRTHTETARILHQIARWFDTDGPHDGPVMDANGNTVGQVTVIDE